MKTMARKRLSGLIRLSLAFIVALTLAAPYTSAAAYANELITNTLRNTDIDLVAYSSDAKASLSLDEAKQLSIPRTRTRQMPPQAKMKLRKRLMRQLLNITRLNQSL